MDERKTGGDDDKRLALTRVAGESVVMQLADSVCVKVKVVKVNGDKVRLAFDAPASVRIDRQEIYDLRTNEVVAGR